MSQEQSNFRALAVFTLCINQLGQNPGRQEKSAGAGEGQRQ
jgi:hypothetical protein